MELLSGDGAVRAQREDLVDFEVGVGVGDLLPSSSSSSSSVTVSGEVDAGK